MNADSYIREMKLTVHDRPVTVKFSDRPKPNIAKQLKDALIETYIRETSSVKKNGGFLYEDAR